MQNLYAIPDHLPMPGPEQIPARITAVHRGMLEAACEHGLVPAVLKTAVYYTGGGEAFPAVGDLVSLQYNPHGESLVTGTFPRTSQFSRNDFSGHAPGYAKTIVEQVVAANFHYVLLMASLNHDFKTRRIERYLVQAWQSGGSPVVVLTKADLAQDIAPKIAEAQRVAAGVEVIALSAYTGEGLAALRPYTGPGSIAVLLGSSGVGKSSLVNALMGRETMKVNSIRGDDSKGRHTTTHRQMIPLPTGGLVIDTPGMRELGVWDADAGLTGAFADVEELTAQCRFSDCAHHTEPGCAVRQALEDGSLPQERWQSYQQLQREARYVEDKAAYGRERAAWQKTISKSLRQRGKGGGE